MAWLPCRKSFSNLDMVARIANPFHDLGDWQGFLFFTSHQNISVSPQIQRLPHFLFHKAPFKQNMATSKGYSLLRHSSWPKFCYMILFAERECQSVFQQIKRKNLNLKQEISSLENRNLAKNIKCSIFKYQILNFAFSISKIGKSKIDTIYRILMFLKRALNFAYKIDNSRKFPGNLHDC